MKVLMLEEETFSAAVFRAINRYRPEVTAHFANGFVPPRGYNVLVMGLSFWKTRLGETHKLLFSRNVDLVCLYDPSPPDQGRSRLYQDLIKTIEPCACPAVLYHYSKDFTSGIGTMLHELAQGMTLKETTAYQDGMVTESDPYVLDWKLPERPTPKPRKGVATSVSQDTGDRQDPPVGPSPKTSPPPAAGSGSVYIHQVTVAGDMVTGGKTEAKGDQVNITRGAGGGAPSIQQQAGGDQVNINRPGGEAAPRRQVDACPKCGAAVEPKMRFCFDCGARLEET